MKAVVIVHTNKGGSFRVAKFYAETLDAKLLIKPGWSEIFKLCKGGGGLGLVVFHNVRYAYRYAWLLRILVRNVSIYNVEHYVLTQFLRSEVRTSFRIIKFLFKSYVCRLLSVKTIVLDEYCKRNRRRIIKEDCKVIYNPVLSFEDVGEIVLNECKYDVVWSGGLNKQKRWSEALKMLVNLSSTGLNIAVASYDKPTEHDADEMRKNGIDFYFNCKCWTELADIYFFSSIYEGYPLVLIEAIRENKKIIAWCHSSCYFQVLKNGGSSVFIPSTLEGFDILEAIDRLDSVAPIDSSRLLSRHEPDNVREQILSLK